MTDNQPPERYELEQLLSRDQLDIPEPPSAIGVGKDGEPRLIITKIVNTDFKSYAGTKIIGPFHKAFTSIIGPNGSGKSNVIDSMLFVFGYRANKIRNKKVSGLIHNSQLFPNVKSATVAVHFAMINDIQDDPDAFDIIPGSEFVVSRTAFKDNSSSYGIDGRKTNFKEVGKLLRTKGIDLDHNRFLILQGEVEQISQMKPKAENPNEEGMLEYLEDIIGSSRLKPLIDVLNIQVEQLNEYRTERNNRVKLAEEDKNKLQEGFDEAKKWVDTKNELTRLSNQLYQAEKYFNDKKVNAHGEEIVKIAEERENVKNEIQEEKEKHKETHKEFDKANKKKTKVTNLLQANKDKGNELEAKNAELHEEKKMKKKRKKELEKNLTTEEGKVKKFSEMPEKCQEEEDELNEKIEKLVSDEKTFNSELQYAIESVEKDTAKFRKQKEPLEKKMMDKQEVVNKCQGVLTEAKEAQGSFTEQYDRAVAELEKIEGEIQKTQENGQAQLNELEKLKNEVPEKSEILKEKEDKIGPLKNERLKCQEDLSEIQVKLNEAKDQGGDTRQKNQVFDYIVNHLKKKNKVSGIYGRLGDLGGIDRKYDVAISSSCNLDVVVVETALQGKEILGHLERDNVGAVTIFALDKLRPFQNARDLPGPRLVDQIRCDNEQVMAAFYKACGDTLVARDPIEAERMSGHRYRVVSTCGAVIEPTGTITGGGGKPRSGAMGEEPTVRMNESVIPESDIQEMEDQVNRLRTRMREIDDEIKTLNNDIRILKNEIAKKSNRLEHLKSLKSTDADKISMLESRLPKQKDLVAKLKPNKKELQKMEDVVKEAECDFGAAQANFETAKEAVDEINKKMVEIGKGRIEGHKKQIEKAKKEMKDAKKKILKVQNDAKTAGRNRDKAIQAVESIKSELLEIEERQKTIAEETEKLATEFQEVTDDKTELEEAATEIAKKVEEASKNVEKFEKMVENLKNKEASCDRKLVEINEKCAEIKHLTKSFDSRLRKLEIQEIEDGQDLTLEQFTPEALEEVDMAFLRVQNSKVDEHERQRPNLRAIQEYRERNKVYNERVKEFNEVNDARNFKRDLRNDLIKQRTHEFMAGFETITDKVKQMYQMITLGGDAELEMVNTLAPFEDGVVFTVRPPKKSWKNIWNLSGGEKTLSSLALVFALHHYKPTPLYVMDEIDAALDIKNVSIVAHYIKDRTKNAQFIIISLRNQMFDLASKLVGIYKTDNTTKTVVMQNEQAKSSEQTQKVRNPSGSQMSSNNILQSTQ